MPVTLIQATPTSDTTVVDLSAEYVNQLSVTGATGLITYVTTSDSPSLLVSGNGTVSATGTLEIGPYTVSGTVSDSNGDSGVWTFTLTVLAGIPTPQTSVTPVIAALPTGVEMSVPFQIDPATGAVAVLFDYVSILEQHIETIVRTVVGERVMLPNYGSNLEDSVFAPIQPMVVALMADDIKKAVQQWESAVNILAVTVTSNPAVSQTSLLIRVAFAVVPYTDVSVLSVSTGGGIAQVVAP